MAYILPNGKVLKRSTGVKNKISPTKIGAVHRKLLSILFDIRESTVAKEFQKNGYSIRNPYAVKMYIKRKYEKNDGFKCKWKERRKV